MDGQVPKRGGWRKSSYSGGTGQCVQVAVDGEWYLVGDSKDPGGPALSVPAREFAALLDGIRAGRLEA